MEAAPALRTSLLEDIAIGKSIYPGAFSYGVFDRIGAEFSQFDADRSRSLDVYFRHLICIKLPAPPTFTSA